MKRFVEGEDRTQAVLLPEYLEDYVSDDNPVRVVDVFVDELVLHELGFDGTAPAATCGPRIIHLYCSRFISTAI